MHSQRKSSYRRPWRQENRVYELNRKVLSERLKQSRDAGEWRCSDDRVFQASGPDVENARGSNVTVCVIGTRSSLSSANGAENDLRQRQSAVEISPKSKKYAEKL